MSGKNIGCSPQTDSLIMTATWIDVGSVFNPQGLDCCCSSPLPQSSIIISHYHHSIPHT